MANYTKTTNFTAKDSLSSGNPLKIVRGAEFDTEFNNVATALQTKADSTSPALTGTATAVNLTVSGALLVGTDVATTNTATQILTNKTIALGSNTVSGTTAQFNSALTDGDFATIAGTETLTNKTLTSPVVSGGSIDNSPIGSTTRSSVKATILDLGLSTQSVAIGQGNASLMKNRLINGACVFDQRNAGASVTPTTSAFTLDRWALSINQASKFSVQQNAGSVTPPVGFSNYLGVTSLSAYSVLTGDYFSIAQYIEGFNTADLGWGTANAKTVTLSFQVYSSLTGTFGGSLSNSAFNYSYPFTYSIPVANTWTTISVTIAGPTAGTWIGATNGLGLRVYFGLGAGATYSGTAGSWSTNGYFTATGATSVVGTSGATFYITGIQLEVGSSATGFEYRQYGQELALCERTCSTVNIACDFVSGNYYTSSITYPVTMRAVPTKTLIGTATQSNMSAINWDANTTANSYGSNIQFQSTTANARAYYFAQYLLTAEL